MKQFVTAGTLAVALAVGGTALAQQPPPPPPAKTPPAAKTDQAEKPAPKPPAKRAATAGNAQAGHAAPNAQPGTASEASAPDGSLPLGTVHLPKGVKADGKELPAGTYLVRLTPE